jgi:uncharacterized membrane protein YhaH (DUF805 family)
MTPIEWATRPLKKYADFSGRAPRAEYWWFYLFLIIAYFVAVFIDMTLGSSLIGPYGILTTLLWLAILIPTIAVGVRRLHDIDRTGWWMLAPIVPYLIGFAMMGPALLNPEQAATATASMGIGGIFMMIGAVMALVLFVFSLLPGTKGPNRFGPDPYGENLETVFS